MLLCLYKFKFLGLSDMIVFREGKPEHWKYKDKNGVIITNVDILEYIKKLVIPPAYQDVQIFYEKGKIPKMVYFGFDSKGRKQQIYSKQWRERADKKKFKALIEFGKKLPQITLKIQEHIREKELSKNKLIAIILRITTLCGFRIGQLKYQKLYGSIGLSTLQKKHLKQTKNGIEIKFIGKKGMLNECVVKDKSIIEQLSILAYSKAPNDFLFTIGNELITAIEVNNWLKAYNPDFTTKFFRTFDVNDKLLDILRNDIEDTLSKRKKKIVELIKQISGEINNTPTICKKSYINPNLLDLYINHPKKFKSLVDSPDPSRVLFIKILEGI
jgi:DNA topoisomerase I